MTRYEVIESKVWKRDDGRTASIYGALPYFGDAEKSRWQIVTRGWTIRDNNENTVGMACIPYKTVAEANEACDRLNSAYHARLAEYQASQSD